MVEALLLLVLGALTGFIGASLGVGGGFFLVPILVLLFHATLAQAVAAGLVAVIATSSSGAAVNLGKGTVNVRLGVFLETATVLGALTGAAVAKALPERLLLGLFSAMLAAICVLLWRKPEESDEPSSAKSRGSFPQSFLDPETGAERRYAVRRLPLAMAASFVAGNLSSMFGVGGGILKVPVLHVFCGMPMKACTATSNFMIGVTAAAGALLYFDRGDMQPMLTGLVALGVMAGSRLGTAAGSRAKDDILRRGFGLLCLFLAAQLLRRAW